METINIKQKIQQMLCPKPWLHPKVFYDDKMMINDVRKILLKAALTIYNAIGQDFQGIKLKDIVLIGSTTSYLWTPESDFDIKIIFDIDNNFFIKNRKKAKLFLRECVMRYYKKVSKFRYNNRLIDIKFDFKYEKMHGSYSLLHNAWIDIPNKEATLGIKAEEIYNAHLEKTFLIRKLINQDLSKLSYKQKMQAIKKLRKEHIKLFLMQFLNTKEHLIYKTLKYNQMQKEFIRFCNDYLINLLSISGEE